ncbi:MAG TPA: hypothetical protein VFP10_14435 [Candidatus Eisenbacteria bacterium]|nr:hypothetical protein [Candidatus Eisenbacteria bacterium]
MKHFSTAAALIALGWFLLSAEGCSKEKKPRYTSVPVTGYPYPFGISVKNLLGRAQWVVVAGEDSCARRYRSYRLEAAREGTGWSGYEAAVLIADSLETLQGFSATQLFQDQKEIDTHMLELLTEVRRRYGAQTDSTAEGKRILERSWRDAAGNVLRIHTGANTMLVQAISGRVWRECPKLLSEPPASP